MGSSSLSVLLAVLAWARRFWNKFGMIFYKAIAGAALASIVWFNNWNLIEFRRSDAERTVTRVVFLPVSLALAIQYARVI
jgi:hypothetical protein